MKRNLFLAVLFLTAGCLPMLSQEKESAHYQVPEPEIQFTTSSENVVFGIGGAIKLTANMDFGATLSNPNDFLVSEIPFAPEKGTSPRFGMSAQQSGLNFMFKYLPGDKHQIAAYVNFMLLGDDYLPYLDYAFMTYRGILAGWNYTLFSDQDAGIPSIDHEGPIAYTALQNAVFDVAGFFTPHVSAGIGVELSKESYASEGYLINATQILPDIPAFIKYRFGETSWIRLSALFRAMRYACIWNEFDGVKVTPDVLSPGYHTRLGWGLQFSGGLQITPRLSLLWQATGGEGISNYYQDLDGMELDMTVTSENGLLEMRTVKSWGGYAGLQYQWSDKVQSNVAYSHLRLYPHKNSLGDAIDEYKYGQNLLANIFWDFAPHMQWGLEYIWGRRVGREPGVSNHDNRIQTMIAFSF